MSLWLGECEQLDAGSGRALVAMMRTADLGDGDNPASRRRFPEELEALSMPAHGGFGLHDDEAGASFPTLEIRKSRRGGRSGEAGVA